LQQKSEFISLRSLCRYFGKKMGYEDTTISSDFKEKKKKEKKLVQIPSLVTIRPVA